MRWCGLCPWSVHTSSSIKCSSARIVSDLIYETGNANTRTRKLKQTYANEIQTGFISCLTSESNTICLMCSHECDHLHQACVNTTQFINRVVRSRKRGKKEEAQYDNINNGTNSRKPIWTFTLKGWVAFKSLGVKLYFCTRVWVYRKLFVC